MRTEQQIKDRVQMAIIEEMQSTNFTEPENTIPKFIENLTHKINEIILDEIMMRRRF